MPDIFETTAQQYESVAAELETAAKHLRVTAGHLRECEVPRGCAHAWAATGQLHYAQTELAALSLKHAAKSKTE